MASLKEQFLEAKKLEMRRHYEKATLIYQSLYNSDLRRDPEFIVSYSLYLEKIGCTEEAYKILKSYLSEEKRIHSFHNEILQKRLAQLTSRLGIYQSQHLSPTSFKSKFAFPKLNSRDTIISLILILVLITTSLYSTVYKETYEAKLLDMKIADIVGPNNQTSLSEDPLPPISEQSLRDARQHLSESALFSRSKIIVKNGIIGIAVVLDNGQDNSKAKLAIIQILRQLGKANSGGDFHLRSPTTSTLGGLYDYYNAAIIIASNSNKVLHTGIKTKVQNQIQWEEQ